MIDFSDAKLGTKLIAKNGYVCIVQGIEEMTNQYGIKTGVNAIYAIRPGMFYENGIPFKIFIPPRYFENFSVVDD